MRPISQAVERAFGPSVRGLCMTCRGPIPYPGVVVIELGEDEESFTCQACGRGTDQKGRSIERVSTDPVIEIIEIDRRRSE